MLLHYVQIHQVNSWIDYLVSVLRSNDSTCVISYDHKGHWPEIKDLPPRLWLRSSGPITWGGGSQVTALLQMFIHALTLPQQWSYLINLSGQDVPLKTPEQMADFEKRAKIRNTDAFVNFYGTMGGVAEQLAIWDGIPDSYEDDFEEIFLKGRVKAEISRVVRARFFSPDTDPEMRYYCRHLFECKNNYARKCLRIDKPSPAEIERRRDILARYGSHGGRAWYILSRRFVEEFVNSPVARELAAYLDNVFCGDELFIQTWIRTESARLKLNIVDANMRFRTGDPVELSDTLVPELEASSALFARKFDPARQPRLAEWIQQRVPAPEVLDISRLLQQAG
ncbi:beta-1,6-N-acetylglucosaminyltransferase [Teichococcus vastitatis]|uniref:Peptide O-xylosyltransferase n=1 Tax=Teichococcus vastitatis TaxID=2307076 RepID=A0ABS9W3I4_9PROT|nr:beta-1,6-N-acetylglucosaminyltransferase [Pseudoroseomonas vastitatis]MCI0753144.1 beta-1,6-N-acetylglucosaminyltransferase [Pseudoroseomonas vastitatis]